MLCTTYNRNIKVVGTTIHNTFGDFERVQVIATLGKDQVWCIVKRKIEGKIRRYVELYDVGDGTDDLDVFSDSSLCISNFVNIENISNSNPAVVTSTAHGLIDDDSIIIKEVKDPENLDLDPDKKNMSTLNGCVFTVSNFTPNTFELSGLNTTDYNSYESAGKIWKRFGVISGLDHLEGKVVKIRGDGAVQTEQLVQNGTITLPFLSGEVVIGLAYETKITTLAKDFDNGIGTMIGQQVRWSRPLVRVNNSVPPLMNNAFLPSRNTNDFLDKKVPLTNGFLVYGPLTWSNTTELVLTISDPAPLEITGITGAIDSGSK